jgi:hypothetical protein
MEVSCPFHALAALPLGKAPGTHWIGGWVGPGVDLDDVEKRKLLTLLGLELRPLGLPERGQLLYRLRQSGSAVSCGAL